MEFFVVKVRKLDKKNGGGEFYIVDILVICDKFSGIMQQFIDLKQYNALYGLLEDRSSLPIDEKFLETKFINNELVKRVNFDNLLSNI